MHGIRCVNCLQAHTLDRMEGKTITVSVRMPPELRDRLQAMAEENDRTLSQLCMLVLRDFVKAQEAEASK